MEAAVHDSFLQRDPAKLKEVICPGHRILLPIDPAR
jgi:hypothetical protein